MLRLSFRGDAERGEPGIQLLRKTLRSGFRANARGPGTTNEGPSHNMAGFAPAKARQG